MKSHDDVDTVHDTDDNIDDDTDDNTNDDTDDDTDDGGRANLYPLKAPGSRTLSRHGRDNKTIESF